MSFPRSVSVIYCDDVREELGNKMSYMGIYGNSLVVPKFPTVLPKLCIIVEVRTPISQPFEKLIVRIIQDEEEVGNVEADGDVLTNIFQSQDQDDSEGPGDEKFMMAKVVANIAPLVVSKAQSIKIRVDTEAGELKGPALKITKREEEKTSV